MTDFDWDAYDRLCEEIGSLNLAEDSYHTSLANLEHQGWDEHGVMPGEGAIYERRRAELYAALDALGTPPVCPACHGCGYYYAGSRETDFEPFPSQCHACRGTGEYDVVSPPRTPYPANCADDQPLYECEVVMLTDEEAIAQGHKSAPVEHQIEEIDWDAIPF